MTTKVHTTIRLAATEKTTSEFLEIVKTQYMNRCQAYGHDHLELTTQVEATPSPSLTIDELDKLLSTMGDVDSTDRGFIINAACELIKVPLKYTECSHCMSHFIDTTKTELCNTCMPLYYEGL
ncbi:MAG: hypothetical protein V3V74_07385 [Nitrosomonadaceae bacterium]